MNNKLIFIILIVFSFSCSKENSRRWIVFDLRVENTANDEPAPANFFLSYYSNNGPGEAQETIIGIGSAENGLFKKEVNVPRNSFNHELKYRSSLSMIYSHYNEGIYSGIYSVSKNGINQFNVKIDPVYHYGLNFNNVNCYNSFDTLWLTQLDFDISDVPPNFIFTGCNGGGVSDLIGFDSIVDFKYVLKRNGVITEHEVVKIASWNYSLIEIDY